MLSGGPTQTAMSPTGAAGRPPISTVGAPGPDDRPADMRDRRHARRLHRADVHVGEAGGGGHLVDLHQRAVDGQHRPRLERAQPVPPAASDSLASACA